MFERKTPLTERLADAVDLMIDLATLGEYGFEPVAEPAPGGCAGRRRSVPPAAPLDQQRRLPART